MLIAYLLLTFTLTWGVAAAFVVAPDALSAAFGPLRMTNPLFVLAVYGPAIAALIVVAWAGGLAGVRGLLGRLGRWRCGPGWYLLILVGFPAIMCSVPLPGERLPRTRSITARSAPCWLRSRRPPRSARWRSSAGAA